jgi:N-acetylmuramoyl-L-alanine amidase
VYDGEIDGGFGEVTELAVRAAQRRAGLEDDGIVGPATWDAIR